MTDSFQEDALNQEQLCQLYEQDYYLWLETTRQLLAEGRLAALDIATFPELSPFSQEQTLNADYLPE